MSSVDGTTGTPRDRRAANRTISAFKSPRTFRMEIAKSAALAVHAGVDGTAMTEEDHRR